MLDESLEILTAGMRFLPRPGATAGSADLGRRVPRERPMRRAARYQGFFPAGVERPDQFAGIAAAVTALREQAERATETTEPTEPYDLVATLPRGTDPAPYAAAGATWWLVEFEPDEATTDRVRGAIHER